jgi:hypothetical protein
MGKAATIEGCGAIESGFSSRCINADGSKVEARLGRARGAEPAVAPESRQKGTVHVHGPFLVGKDPKEVEERVEPSILGAGSSDPWEP